jgi:hypothetical protein
MWALETCPSRELQRVRTGMARQELLKAPGLPALRVGQAIGPGTKDGLWVGQWARLWREYAGQDERTLKASDPPIVEALF